MFPYTNNDTLLLPENLPGVGTYYDNKSLLLIPSGLYRINQIPTCDLEVHAYDLQGNYLVGTSAADPANWSINPVTSSDYPYAINVDIETQLKDLGLLRGQYLTVVNLHKEEIGGANTPSFYIKNISTSRTELRLSPIDSTDSTFQTQYINTVNTFSNALLYAINDFNRTYPVFNDNGITYVPSGSNEPLYYINDPAIRLAFDQNISLEIANPSTYNGTTFLPIGFALAGYRIRVATKVAQTILWFQGANIEMSATTINNFANEINYFIASLGAQTNIEAVATIESGYLNEFWLRNTDGTYKHVGSLYFNSVTLANARYNIVPFAYPVDFILNFGNNNIAKIINMVYESPWNIIVKLASPLDVTFQELDPLWIASEITQPLVEKVLLVNALVPNTGYILRGPNFDIDVEEAQSIATSLKSWNDLLSANVSTNQQLIDKYFSGSLDGIALNINYSQFDNFVHFSSAEERVANFKYKLQMVEFYTERINTLNSVTSASVVLNIAEAESNRNAIISGFDGFEKYLFFETTGSQLYTFATASIQPWPKQNLSSGSVDYTNQLPTTSDVAIAYYNDLISQAQVFDRFNIHSLRHTIPAHISIDPLNEDYITFVDMIGHFYDIIWSYINHLTRINVREENTHDGVSQDLVYSIAKSLGIDVYNGKSSQDLWSYALGVNTSGSFMTSGSMQSLSHEQMTKEVWRRLIDNLPYLYKTKGTARSIKALLTCYGIPTTLLTIKEFGGINSDNPTVDPYYIHDVYNYAYVATGSYNSGSANDYIYLATPWYEFNYVTHDPNQFDPSHDTGISYQVPDAIEFRFRTTSTQNYDVGTNYSLVRSSGAPSDITGSDSSIFEVTLERTTDELGKLNFYLLTGSLGTTNFISGSIEDIYLFNDDWITVVLQRNISGDSVPSGQSYTLKYQRGLYGKIVQSGSTTLTDDYGNWTKPSYIFFGRSNSDCSNAPVRSFKFNGLYQEVRYWNNVLSDDAISNHTLSPSSYNGNNHYSAYYDLIFRTSLSTLNNLQADTGSGFLYIPSQEPNQTCNPGLKTIFVGADGGKQDILNMFQSVEETYYTLYADLTAHTIHSDKIRIESQSLSGPLSPNQSMVQSSLDRNSVDSNKLGIYFSPQNGINDDIVNDLGYVSLDDYIGDPRDQYQPTYAHLDGLRYDYWKKYQVKNNFEAYFNALKLYDLSIFRQIKKFVPARVNLISGIVVEPNLLERNKARYFRRPEVENLVQNATIDLSGSNTVSANYIDPLLIDLTMVESVGAQYITPLTSSVVLYTIATTPYSIGTNNSGSVLLPNVIMTNIPNYSIVDYWLTGTQSTSAGINVPSLDTFDLGPVVVVTPANPNQIIVQNGGSAGNFAIH